MVVSAAWLAATGRRLGDTVRVAGGYDPQLRRTTGERLVRVVGRGRFQMLAATDRAAAVPLATAQAMGGADRTDRVSVLLVETRAGADAEALARRIESREPRLTALSTEAALKAFADFNLSNLAKDRDGDPVFMARSAWDVGYQQEKNPDLVFSATKER